MRHFWETLTTSVTPRESGGRVDIFVPLVETGEELKKFRDLRHPFGFSSIVVKVLYVSKITHENKWLSFFKGSEKQVPQLSACQWVGSSSGNSVLQWNQSRSKSISPRFVSTCLSFVTDVFYPQSSSSISVFDDIFVSFLQNKAWMFWCSWVSWQTCSFPVQLDWRDPMLEVKLLISCPNVLNLTFI